MALKHIVSVAGMVLITACSPACTSMSGLQHAIDKSLTTPLTGRISKQFPLEDELVQLRADVKGELKTNDAESDFIQFPADSSLEFYTEQPAKRLILRSADNAKGYTSEYLIDGQVKSFEPQGKRWLQALIPQLYRETGYEYKNRISRIMKSAGKEGVFTEISLIYSDMVTNLYIRSLISNYSMTDEDVERLLKLAESIESDYEMRVLCQTLLNNDLSEQNLMQLIRLAADHIQSSQELPLVLTEVLETKNVTSAMLNQLEEASMKISSKSEREKFLQLLNTRKR